ncbi:pyrroline-5-carboxylate reductase [Pseudoruegeria sp. SK021]|uniref:pyrroline-5-carboxylate reductase n=1 Tax=Pseudoruegeria sp. SK021 TaxID=1933035 RepID=UPI000A242376|nr:pyrroline-5-carboxylate reductase [Pseudoruegeria sp. SK021]OSP55737.1 pyrroline-5-carboxylate reductase [Pseudoruegeria sp. SK021]
MTFDDLSARGLVLLGCGKMGSAMLAGWLAQGVDASSVWIVDPNPSDWLRGIAGLRLNQTLPDRPALVVIAVKPQMMQDALPSLHAFGNGETIFLSVAAGVPIAQYEAMLGDRTPILRAMPNTPAAISKGITALIGNAAADASAVNLAEALLGAVGQVVRLDHEGQMDAVTAVSGSGPAYVFHMIEAMAAAGEAEGLPADLAMALAKATVSGAGQLAEPADADPAQLRINVTSPGGTTAAALAVLMAEGGLGSVMSDAIRAAAARSRELGS